MCIEKWQKTVFDLIVNTSTAIPPDVTKALKDAAGREDPDANAASMLGKMQNNIALANDKVAPVCQDTGTLLFWVHAPPGVPQYPVRRAIRRAITQATEEGYLRRNCIDPVSGKNAEDNVGPGNPVIEWVERPDADICNIALIMKGGGSENVSVQYSLPEKSLGAERNFEGVRRCVLDAVWQAQGKGCAPGVLSVVVGGDRATGYKESKRLFLRKLGTANEDPLLQNMEMRIYQDANRLGIGPMGLGGKTTVLDVFAESLHRVPASYFVTIGYMCWAFRRRSISVSSEGELYGYEI